MARSSAGRETSQNEALLNAIFHTHGQAVVAYATRLMADRAKAEDVAQETLLRAWRHPEILVYGKEHVRCWLFKVARNLVNDYFRAQKIHPQEVPEDPMRPPVEHDHAQRVVDELAVLDELSKLSKDHRAVLEQVYILDRSVREAAKELGVPEGTIKSRTAHALLALRKLMSPSGDPPEAVDQHKRRAWFPER